MIFIDEKIIIGEKILTEDHDDCIAELVPGTVTDTLICYDKEDACKYIDNIGSQWIQAFETLKDGRIKLFLKNGWEGGYNESQRLSSSD